MYIIVYKHFIQFFCSDIKLVIRIYDQKFGTNNSFLWDKAIRLYKGIIIWNGGPWPVSLSIYLNGQWEDCLHSDSDKHYVKVRSCTLCEEETNHIISISLCHNHHKYIHIMFSNWYTFTFTASITEVSHST